MRKLFLAAICAVWVGGCVGNDGTSMFIMGVRPPDLESGCALTVGSDFLPRGRFNLDEGGSYLLTAQIQSQVISRELTAPAGANPNGIVLKYATVELYTLSGTGRAKVDVGASNPNPFRTAITGYIPPASAPSSPTMLVTGIEIIPSSYTETLQSQLVDGAGFVIASVSLVGETVGGITVDTPEFTWPIDLGEGGYLYECVQTTMDELIACFPGQDVTSYVVAVNAPEGLCD